MVITAKRFRKSHAIGAVILLGALLAALIILTRGCTEDTEPLLSCNEDRIAYLNSLGWEVGDEPLETLHLQLPEDFTGTEYEAYNESQLAQGFDLTDCAGRQVTRYTYCIENHPDSRDDVQLNLYICDGRVVGGDVIALGENGFTAPLEFPVG